MCDYTIYVFRRQRDDHLSFVIRFTLKKFFVYLHNMVFEHKKNETVYIIYTVCIRFNDSNYYYCMMLYNYDFKKYIQNIFECNCKL